MEIEDFNDSVDAVLGRSRLLLVEKAKEYATVGADRLHQFKIVAEMRNTTQLDAIGGMMAKHTTSIYDMISDSKDHGISHPLATWNEKIVDHINYLLFLHAAIVEDLPHFIIEEPPTEGQSKESFTGVWDSFEDQKIDGDIDTFVKGEQEYEHLNSRDRVVINMNVHNHERPI